MIPIWGWLLIDFAVLAIGAVWWLYLLWELKNRAERIGHTLEPLLQTINDLQEQLGEPGDYQPPVPDTESDSREMESRWAHRKAASQQKKRDRQRRLIARLRK
jgi:hypothetical protein